MARVKLDTLFLLFIFLIQNASGVPNHLLPSSTNLSVDAPLTAESSNITKYLRYSTKDTKSSFNTLSNSNTTSKFKFPYSSDRKEASFFDSNKFPLHYINNFHNNTKTSESVVSSEYPMEPSTTMHNFVYPDSLHSETPTVKDFPLSGVPTAAENLDNQKTQSKNCYSSLLNTNSSKMSKDVIDIISSADQQSASRNMRQTSNFFNTPTSNIPKFLNFPNSAKLSTHDSESKISSSCFTANDSKLDITATNKPRFSNPVFERIFRPKSQLSQFSDRFSQQSDNSAINDSVKSQMSATSNISKQNLNYIPNFTAFPSKVTKLPEDILKSSKSVSKTAINSQNKLTTEVNPFTSFRNPYSSYTTYQNRNSVSRPFYSKEKLSQNDKIACDTIPKSEIKPNIQNTHIGPVTRNYLTKNGVQISDLTPEAKPYTVTPPSNTNFLNTNSYTSVNNPTAFLSQKPQNYAPCEKIPISSTVLDNASAIQQYNSKIIPKNMDSDQTNIISSADVPLQLQIGTQHDTSISNQNYQPNGPFTRIRVNFSPSDKPSSYNYIPASMSLQQQTNTDPISLPFTYLSEVSPSTRTIPSISTLPTVGSSAKVISSLLPTQTVTSSSSIPQELQDFIPRANDLSSKIVSSINDVTTSISNNLLNSAANSLPPLNTYTIPNPSPNLFSAPVFSPIFWPLNNPDISTFTQQPNFPLPITSIISNPYVILTSNKNELSVPFNSVSPDGNINPPSLYELKPIIKSSTSDSKQLLPYIQTVTLNLPYLAEDTSENIILPYIISSTKNDCSCLAAPLTTSNWNEASYYPSYIGPPIIKMGTKNNSKDLKRLLEFMVIAEFLNNDKTCNFNAMDNIIALLCLSL